MSIISTLARHSTDSPDWRTPASIVDAAREVMGGIDLDPASDEEANLIVKASRYYTVQDDGLKQPWRGRVFLNPPGGLVKEFWHHLMFADFQQCIWIGYSLEQLQTLQDGVHLTPLDFPICVPKRRIAFQENDAKREARTARLRALGKTPNKKSQPSHGNYISYFGSNPSAFVRVFGRFGQVKL